MGTWSLQRATFSTAESIVNVAPVLLSSWHTAHRVGERRKLYTIGFSADRIWRHPGQWVRDELASV